MYINVCIYIYISIVPWKMNSEPKKSLNVKGKSSEPNLIFSDSKC